MAELGFETFVDRAELEPASRPYWNMSVEPRLGDAALAKLQTARLARTLARAAQRSVLHRERFAAAGVRPEEVRTLDDLAALPLWTREDQRSSQERSERELGHPYGMHLCIPVRDLRLVAATSGTTGTPAFYLFGDDDLRIYDEERARAFWRIGLRPGDAWLHAFALSLFLGGVPLVMGARAFGLCVVPVGAEAGTEAILRLALRVRPAALCATPSLARHLVERAPAVLGVPAAALGVRVLVLGGEPGAGLPELRAHLEESFGARVYDIQGPTASCQAPTYQGMHRFLEDLEVRELVDPATRRAIPFKDGAVGEGVVTSLLDRAAPLVRFATGDLHEVRVSPCPCGRTGIRYRIVGRVDELLKVKGVAVYPPAIVGVVAAFRPRVTGEMRIVLGGPPPRVEPPLRLRVEAGPATSESSLPSLAAELAEAMHARLRVRPAIEWVRAGALLRTGRKTSLLLRADLGEG